MRIDYEHDMDINESALDIEWLDQANKMMKYAWNAAETKKKLDLIKEKLESVKGDIDKAIREDPKAFGLDKVTDKAIEAITVTEERYKVTYQEFVFAKYEADMAQGAVRAMEGRREALENLVKLNGQQYFAGPKTPRDISKERMEWQNKINASIAQKIRRRNSE